MQNDQYEYDFIKSLLKPSDICLDIGANVGYYTKLMAEEGVFVYAFEPDKDNFKKLQENMVWTPRINYTLFNKAVTDHIGFVKLYKCNLDIGMHRIYPSKWWYNSNSAVKEVECVNIDSLNLPMVDFVKIDVEGSEYSVLQGMKKTILKFKPAMVIEFHPPTLEEYNPSHPRKIYDFLKKHYDGSITLLATSYIPETKDVQDISYHDLIAHTYDNPAMNIFVSKENP